LLVTCRREGQSIRIGDDIEITVAEIHRSKVMLGITAPKHVRVLRAEVLEVEQENTAAAESGSALLKKFKPGAVGPIRVSEGRTRR
jgi:carbon storage regulator